MNSFLLILHKRGEIEFYYIILRLIYVKSIIKIYHSDKRKKTINSIKPDNNSMDNIVGCLVGTLKQL